MSFVVALTLALFAFHQSAAAQHLVFPPGREAEILALARPYELGRPAEDGLELRNVDIRGSHVSYELFQDGERLVTIVLSIEGSSEVGVRAEPALDQLPEPARGRVERLAAQIRERAGDSFTEENAVRADEADASRALPRSLPPALLLLAVFFTVAVWAQDRFRRAPALALGRPLPRVRAWWPPLLVGVYLLAFLVLVAHPLITDDDTLRNLLYARDCTDAGLCHSSGATSGLGGFRHGASWIWLLVAARLLHAGVDHVHLLDIGCTAAAGAIVFSIARRFAGDAMSVGAALVYALVARELGPLDVLHNPSLLPLATALFTWASLRVVERRRTSDALVAALALACAIDLHGIAALSIVPFVALVGACQRRPFVSALGCAAVIVLYLWNVSGTAFEANVANAASHGLALGGVALCTVALVAGVVSRRRFAALPPREQLLVALGSNLAHPLLVVALVSAYAENHLPYYYLPSLPAACVLVVAFAHPIVVRNAVVNRVEPALLLCVAAAPLVALGLRAAEPPHPEVCLGSIGLDQLAVVAPRLSARGLRYQDAFVRLQGRPRAGLIAGVAAFEREPRPGEARSGPVTSVLVVRRGAVPHGVESLAIPRDAAAAILRVDSWLDRERVALCQAPAESEDAGDCATFAVAPPAQAVGATLSFFARALPVIDGIARARREGRLRAWSEGGTRVSLRFDARARGGTGRLLWLDEPGGSCPWEIARVEGLAHEGDLPAGSVVVRRGASASGTVEVARVVGGPRCPIDMPELPPSLVEVDVDDAPAMELADRCRPISIGGELPSAEGAPAQSWKQSTRCPTLQSVAPPAWKNAVVELENPVEPLPLIVQDPHVWVPATPGVSAPAQTRWLS